MLIKRKSTKKQKAESKEGSLSNKDRNLDKRAKGLMGIWRKMGFGAMVNWVGAADHSHEI